jgi:hypothetical protein
MLDTTSTSAVTPPPPPLCVDVTYTVQAFNASVGWLSTILGPVAFQRQPSSTQPCTTPPAVVVGNGGGRALRVKLKALKKAKWKLDVRVSVDGLGRLTGVLRPMKGRKKGKPVVTIGRDIAAATAIKLQIVFPKTARKPARFVLQLETGAPLGTAVKRASVTVEVLK